MTGKRKVLSVIKTVVLIMALVFFVVVAICQIYETTNVNDDDDRIVLGVNGSQNASFDQALKGRPVPMDDLVGIVSGGNFTVMDKNGDAKTTENFVLTDPILHSKGDYCVVADYNSDTARLYEKGNVRAEIKTEGKIISVVTNRNGLFAIATEELGYDTIINVYRKNGTAIYRYRVAKHTFIDMDISSNNRKLLVTEVDMRGGEAVSRLVVAELNTESTETVVESIDDLYISVHFNKNSSFSALGTKKLDLYRADTKKTGSIDFNGRTLMCADITEDDMICLAFKGVGETGNSASVLEIYDKNGILRGTATFEDEISNLCVNGSCVAVSHGDVVDIVKSNGKIKKSFETTSPVKYAAPFSGGDAAVIFSGGNTTIMK